MRINYNFVVKENGTSTYYNGVCTDPNLRLSDLIKLQVGPSIETEDLDLYLEDDDIEDDFFNN